MAGPVCGKKVAVKIEAPTPETAPELTKKECKQAKRRFNNKQQQCTKNCWRSRKFTYKLDEATQKCVKVPKTKPKTQPKAKAKLVVAKVAKKRQQAA